MKRIPESQYGGVLVLVAVSITMFCVMLAFALDYGRVILTKSELQAAADSAALAGAAKLVDEGVAEGDDSQDDNIIAARDYAEDFALQNAAGNQFLALDRNDANEVNGGVVVGYIDDPLDLGDEMVTDDVSLYNSVEVQTSLSHTMNSPLGLFLGGITGVQELEMSAKATATLEDRVVGFTPSESENLMMLPFTA